MRPRSNPKKSIAIDENAEETPKLKFEPEQHIKELVSLGSSKITQSIAKQIAAAVGKTLITKNLPVSPETISELVGEELAQLQLFEQSLPKEPLQKIQTEKAQKMIAPFASDSSEGPKEIARLIPKPAALKSISWDEEKLKALYETKKWNKDSSFLSKEQLLSTCEAIAAIDSQYSSENDPHSLAKLSHDFHNLLASKDFLPGSYFFHPDFLKHKKATGRLELAAPQGLNPFEVLESLYALKKQNFNTQLSFPLAAEEYNWDLFLKLLQIRQEQESETQQALEAQDFLILLGETSEKAKDRLDFLLSGKIKMNPSFGISGSLGTPTSTEHSECGDISMLQRTLRINSSLKLFFLGQTVSMSQLSGEDSKYSAQDSSSVRASLPQQNSKLEQTASEKPLLQGQVLPYGYINLSQMTKDEEVDWDRLRKNTRLAVHFLDNLLDFWIYPNPEIKAATQAERKLALGFMGWADLLYTLRIPYESDEALCLAAQIAQLIEEESILASVQLAKDRGVYANYAGSHWEAKSFPVRNAALTQIIEDDFIEALSESTLGINLYSELVKLKTEGEESNIDWVHPFFTQVAKFRGIAQISLLTKIGLQKSLVDIEEVPEDIQKVFVSQKDISWKNQILMAREFERHFAGGINPNISIDFMSDSELKELLLFCEDQGLHSLKLLKSTPAFEELKEEDFILSESLLEKTETDIVTEEAAAPIEEEVPEEERIEEEATICESASQPLAEVFQLLPLLANPILPEEEILDTEAFIESVELEEEQTVYAYAISDIPFDVMTGLKFDKNTQAHSIPPLEVMAGFSNPKVEEKPIPVFVPEAPVVVELVEEVKEMEVVAEEIAEELTEALEIEELTEVIALHNLPEDHAAVAETNADTNFEEEFEEEEVATTDLSEDNTWKPRTRPNQLTGKTYAYVSCCGRLWITLNHDEEGIFEVLTHLEGKNHSCTASQSILINRFLSLLFQAGVVVEEILAQLSNLSCCSNNPKQTQTLNCFEALAHAIRSHLEEYESEAEESYPQSRWQTLEESEWNLDF